MRMARTVKDFALNDRSQHLLKVLVERYIRDGQPVGSRVLAQESGLELSPATVRSIMADLEEMGLLASPHTSAGRIPTVLGYRFFVDGLLRTEPPHKEDIYRLRSRLMADQDPEVLIETASQLLSDLTHLVGIVMLPRQVHMTLRQVEFLPLSHRRVLVILVVNERQVQNRIIRTDRPYTPSDLEQAANYLNATFVGKDLLAARKQLLQEMQDTQAHLDRMMAVAREMAEKGFVTERDETDMVVAGQINLMEYGDLGGVDKLRDLFEAFNHKRDILHLLDQCLKARRVQIFIGEESGYESLGDCSVITSPYQADGRCVSVLGVIGPTRMPYKRIIPLVDVTAKLLGAALNQRH
nr:heat-inducible transcription repressor HrcA [Gammaproteobacteria bacterium]